MGESEFEVIFVGGGLSSGLCVLALLARRPETRIAVVESGTRLGGNHTWCFHAGDVPREAEGFVGALQVARWPGYAVHFPQRSRDVRSAYGCITSARLHDVVSERLAGAPGSELLLASRATAVEPESVLLADGRMLRAPLVIDATGPSESGLESCGYQKFVGLEVTLDGHSTLSTPIMFDARLPQSDGFRFMYVLPFADGRTLVEETFFADGPGLDEPESIRSILEYLHARGMRVREVHRTERGVLPMPWRDPGFDIAARPLRAGYRGFLFHPVTGYSFPLAVRFALALSASNLAALAGSPLEAFARQQAAQRPFLRLLTRLLFTCFAPERRFRVLEHFYRLPEPVIERFYAAELTALDRARIFWGTPPRGFSLGQALRHHRATGATS